MARGKLFRKNAWDRHANLLPVGLLLFPLLLTLLLSSSRLALLYHCHHHYHHSLYYLVAFTIFVSITTFIIFILHHYFVNFTTCIAIGTTFTLSISVYIVVFSLKSTFPLNHCVVPIEFGKELNSLPSSRSRV